ncbi:MAG: molybdopterin-dependent oxidoreductase, partial [Candidatus Hodarchaeota archaeon]
MKEEHITTHIEEQAPSEEFVTTFCARQDHGGCGLRVYIKEGNVVKITGNPKTQLNQGYLCPKGATFPEILTHPNRLTHPMKRTDYRGKGSWERITWDEALLFIAETLKEIKLNNGARSIAFARGTPKGLEAFFISRLAYTLGTPNIVSPGHVCHIPRETAAFMTHGYFPIPDYEGGPKLVLCWGSNLLNSNEEGLINIQLRKVLNKGTKLIVIDPKRTKLASKADLWLQLRPGTDGALALGLLHEIIFEELYDKDFVSHWTQGFEELQEHVRAFPLKLVSRLTWIPEEKIQKAARLYAQIKPACIQWGNAIEHIPNNFQTCRAISILRGITGNLDVPGGDVSRPDPPIMKISEFVLGKKFRQLKPEILGSEFKLAASRGLVPYQAFLQAILEEKPYPIKALCVFGTNPLLSYTNSSDVYQALQKLEFLCVSDLFMTPTAALADIILPAATNFEFNDIGHYGLRHGFILARFKLVEPPGDCWSDMKIINELAKRMDLEEYFWDDVEEALDALLMPCGFTYQDLKERSMLSGPLDYRKYERLGFRTPSKKVEFYSSKLKEMGYDPLPAYEDIPNVSDQFPLIMTSLKSPFYFHSAHRQIKALRNREPAPYVEIHPETAHQYNIKDNEWIKIKTRKGEIQQKAKLTDTIDPRVIYVSIGWWFPEQGVDTLFRWNRSNINLLTDSSLYNKEMGSTILRGIPCSISKA